MRVCVFVDGENLRHTIVELFEKEFDTQEYLPKNADWAKFCDHIVAEAAGPDGRRLRTYWYVVQHVDFYPQPLSKYNRDTPKLEAWFKQHEKLLSTYTVPVAEPKRTTTLTQMNEDLWKARDNFRGRFEGWATLQNGIAQKHRSVEFRRSGAISYNLVNKRLGQEKTVDVNLAVDMVTLAANFDTALIISGDQDYVPAAQAVKNMGKHVVNVAFQTRGGKLLPGGARRLNQVTDWSIAIDWNEAKKLLAI
jgi:uncharacterized LabA/DUF88 family protein